MMTMPHLAAMDWNHDDELQHATAGTEQLYFQYAGGIRSRKYTEKQGRTTEERIYLGPFEIYRKRVNGTLDLERESLHVSDGSGRICIVETQTIDGDEAPGSPTGSWRYQLSNHLGSAATEVDGSGALISYEEYHPYGTSAYRAVDSSIDVSAKRYRYTGMERDEETGLEYHSARYYVNWLARWTSADPVGISDDIDRYAYARGRPVSGNDRTGNGWLTDTMEAVRQPTGDDGSKNKPTDASETRIERAKEVAAYYSENPSDLAFSVAEGALNAYHTVLTTFAVNPAKKKVEQIRAAARAVRDEVVEDAENVGEGVGRMAIAAQERDLAGGLSGYIQAGRGAWGVMAKAVIARELLAQGATLVRSRLAAELGSNSAAQAGGLAPPPSGPRRSKAQTEQTGTGAAVPEEAGGAGSVAIDANTAIGAIEGGEGAAVDAALAGRNPIIPIQAVKEFLVKGDVHALRGFLSSRGGRVAAGASDEAAATLQTQATALGRRLKAKDAKVAASAQKEGVPLITRDTKLRKFLNAIGIGGESF